MTSTLTRRSLLRGGLVAATSISLGSAFWRDALAALPAQPGPGPYGPLMAPDANGIALPAGFQSRVIARANLPVPGTGYVFPWFPDGQATYATPDGGHILVTNSEIPLTGGASMIRFDADGAIVEAGRILGATSTNCAGGPTPWGTWLSCEEVETGRVWECDPTGAQDAVVHPAMGVFKHEAAAVDHVGQRVYLSEDLGDGGFYRFTPDVYPDLGAGLLEIACVQPSGAVVWRAVPDPSAADTPTRQQVPDSTRFARGEGLWFDGGVVYLATTGDETIHAYDTRTETIAVLYRADDAPDTPLRGVDNLCVSRSGDLFVCEDSYENDPDAMDVCLITPDRRVSRFLKLTGGEHFLPGELASETVGVVFDPSGTRMYFGSQRAGGFGAVYEVSGPFRTERPAPPPASGGGGGGATAPEQDGVPLDPPTATAPTVPLPAPAPPASPSAGAASSSAIGLEVARRVALRRFARRGLTVALTLDAPATVRVRLLTSGGARPQVLARASSDAPRGPLRLRVEPRDAVAARLRTRRRPLRATLEVRIAPAGGVPHTVRRRVLLEAEGR